MRWREVWAVAVALVLAGFTAAWVALRLLLFGLCVTALGGCGTLGATVLLSATAGAAAGGGVAAVVARGVVSSGPPPAVPSDAEWGRAFGPPPTPIKPVPEEWSDLDAAEVAAGRKAARK
jgi:hypothetical protein